MTNNISNEYNMVKILQDVGSNFFPSDISQQRIGMFGFTCEAMARIFGATILDANMRANEYHTITAKKMDTLLADASILGIDVDNSNPAEMVAYIAFDTSLMHREEYCNIDDPNPNYKSYYFIIERDTNINIAGFNFMLEWDILVTARHNEKEYVYSARYLTEGDDDPHNNDMCNNRTYIKEPTLSTLNDRYIQGNIVQKGNNKLFMMRVNLRQMEKHYEYYTVTENDMISLTGIEFQYDDYLSHFNVYYRANQNNDWEYVESVSIYDTSTYDHKTIQYQVDRDAKIIVLNATQFDMPFNSELRIDIFTTKGSNGNITYNGDGSDIVCELKSYDGNHIYNGIDIACVPVTSAKYGKDTPVLEEVRNKVIRAKASRNALDSEYDLYNYMLDRDMINDYVFIKKRSDILECIYGTYTILRTENGDIIPTTTMDLIIPDEDPDNGIYKNDSLITINTGTAFRNLDVNDDYDKSLIDIAKSDFSMDDSMSKFLISVFQRDGLSNSEIAKKEKSDGLKLYGLPYTILYNNQTQLSSLYFTSISKNVNMNSIDPPKDSTYDIMEYDSNFVIDHITISRNSFIGEDSYHITVSLLSNGDYSHCGTDSTSINTGDFANALMLKGFIYSKDVTDMTHEDGKEYPSAFFNFKFVSFTDGVFNFETDIKVEDSITITDESIRIKSPNFMYNTGMIINTSNNSEIENIEPNAVVTMDAINLKLGIGVYYLRDNVTSTTTPSLVLDERKVEASDGKTYRLPLLNDYGYPEFINGDTPYIMTNLYTNSSDLIDVYIDMSYIVRVSTNLSTSGNKNYIYFEDVPLLQYSKSIDSKIVERIIDIITDTKVHLDDLNTRLHDSFSIDYKFFRTYGPCQYFKMKKTDQKAIPKDLDSLDISLELNAIIKPGITATDSEIVSQMKNFLKPYVEKLNGEDDDYTIYMSNIITELEKNFSDILKSVDLVKLNNEDDSYRVLYYDKPDIGNYYDQLNNGRDMIKNYVPEYLNLPLENITINIIR